MNSIDSAAERIAAILTRDIPKMTREKPDPMPRHPAKRPVTIVGVSTPDELAEAARITKEKKEHEARRSRRPRVAHNKQPRVEVVCPCGTVMHLPPWQAKFRKYHSKECRKKYFHGSGSGIKYHFTPAMDEEIRRVYLHEVGMGRRPVVRSLAEKIGVPAWRVKKRALALDVVPTVVKRAKEPEWCDEEKAIVRENATFTIGNIRRKLSAAGYTRSDNAIKIWINRHIGPKPKGNYSARDLGALFGLDEHSVITWIRKGFLKAERRGTNRSNDIWDIRPEDVKAFVIEHVEILDFRKLDRFFLVELLAGEVKG